MSSNLIAPTGIIRFLVVGCRGDPIGTRTAPRFFVKYDAGVTTDGTRVQPMKLLRGVQNVLQARQEAADRAEP